MLFPFILFLSATTVSAKPFIDYSKDTATGTVVAPESKRANNGNTPNNNW